MYKKCIITFKDKKRENEQKQILAKNICKSKKQKVHSKNTVTSSIKIGSLSTLFLLLRCFSATNFIDTIQIDRYSKEQIFSTIFLPTFYLHHLCFVFSTIFLTQSQ